MDGESKPDTFEEPVFQENYEFPAKVHPRLRGGSLHKMRISKSGVEIATWPGLYGNKVSSLILTIPISAIMKTEYLRPLFTSGVGRCRIQYFNEPGEVRSLTFHAVDSGVLSGNIYAQQRLNSYTETVVEILTGLKQGKHDLPLLPALTFTQPSALKKLIYGIVAVFVGGLLSVGSLLDSILSWFFGTFLLCMSLAALGIDYVRVHTGWHPAVKILVSVGIFLAAFVVFVMAMTLYEVLNLV